MYFSNVIRFWKCPHNWKAGNVTEFRTDMERRKQLAAGQISVLEQKLKFTTDQGEN